MDITGYLPPKAPQPLTTALCDTAVVQRLGRGCGKIAHLPWQCVPLIRLDLHDGGCMDLGIDPTVLEPGPLIR